MSDNQTVARWVEPAARAGYFAKGIVYLLVGGLATATAFSAGGRTTDSEGALMTLLRQPFGRALLAILAVGLASYALWRFVAAALDPEEKGTDGQGLMLRAYYTVSGLAYTGLAIEAFRLVLDGGSGGGSGGGAESRTAELMSQPFGRWLVVAVGLAIVGAAGYQFYRSYEAKFVDRMDFSGVSATTRTWLIRIGRGGLAARGVVFLLIGGFVAYAGWTTDPDQAMGTAEALRTLESQPYGPWLLGGVAIGLTLYGAHQIAKSRLRRIG